METKNFVGRDMTEALNALRASLGPDALIVQTRRVPAGSGTKVEITAMPDKNTSSEVKPVPEAAKTKDPTPSREPRPSERTAEHKELHQMRSLLTGEREQPTSATNDVRELRRELAEIKTLFRWLTPSIGQGTILEELMTQGVAPEPLARIGQELATIEGLTEREKVWQALKRLVPTAADGEMLRGKRECLALMGPTGVGKTTTLVKLTAHLLRRGERRIGWISLDNRRIAGAEQLMAYAGILGIPCEVADSRESLYYALERLSGCELILIDTAGVNPRDDRDLTELAGFLKGIPDVKRALLLSATTNGRDMADWVALYDNVGFESLVFTKMDEARYFGALVNVGMTCGRPLAYFSSGQHVTNNLEVATTDTLARLLLP
jgi:flagellar biosynthesis protein FlhF